MQGCKYPQYHNPLQTCNAGWEVCGGLNQFPADVFLLFAPFDLEFTFICFTAPRSKCNGCLRHSKPQYQTEMPNEEFSFWPKVLIRFHLLMQRQSCTEAGEDSFQISAQFGCYAALPLNFGTNPRTVWLANSNALLIFPAVRLLCSSSQIEKKLIKAQT